MKRTHKKYDARNADQAELVRRIHTVMQNEPHGKLAITALPRRCRTHRSSRAFQAAVRQLLQEGFMHEKGSYYMLCKNCFKAETIRIAGGFGFIRDENGTEYFVPGKALCGSMPGDQVLARETASRMEGSPEAEVISVLEEAPDVQISGTVVPTEEGLCVLALGTKLHIDYKDSVPYHIGDKVLCRIVSRGKRHSEHRVRIVLNFGSADNAENCMAARIAELNIPIDFPPEVSSEAEKLSEVGVTAFDLEGRLDLREACIFTIDGAHSKDLDDAVSVQKNETGYLLGVHIADVSHYVRGNSPLDKEAFRRGTSIYYADKVIPMLPPALSNGICSLNAGEDRLTVSAMMQLSAEGELLHAEFRKSVISSRVRGVYSECNELLDGTASGALQEKYAPVKETLHLLDELTDKLELLRKRRGAPELESTEYELLLDEAGLCIGLTPIERGRSERIIEACMLCANEAAARLAREAEFPLVYRIHEKPSPDRITTLKELLVRLGHEPKFNEAEPADIQQLLDECRDEPYFPAVNALTLRSMAKAKYSEEPLGHFGLALKDYAHFTSPIRRYPDLVVHRILSDHLADGSKEWMQKRYAAFVRNAALQSSDTELRAVQLEREADGCYAAEYMQAHVGESFKGVVTSVMEYGLYIMLENHVEGLLHIHELPDGEYELEDGWYLKNTLTGQEYRLGTELEVVCAKADVSSGHIDLALPQKMNQNPEE